MPINSLQWRDSTPHRHLENSSVSIFTFIPILLINYCVCLFFGFSLFFLKNLFIYLFIYLLAALGLRCCAQAFSSCGEQGLLFAVVHGLLIAVASVVAEHTL